MATHGRQPDRRARFARLPKPPAAVKLPYARSHPAHARKDTSGKLMRFLMSQPEWNRHVVSFCTAFDAERKLLPGPDPAYAAIELETFYLFMIVAGERQVKQARQLLTSDTRQYADAAEVMGFTTKRWEARTGTWRSSRPEIPSEGTLSRYFKNAGYERRNEMWRRFFKTEAHTFVSENPDELDICCSDGTAVLTHFTPPKYKPQTRAEKKAGVPKVLVNGGSITAPDAGYVGGDGPKSGSGWTIFPHLTKRQVPVNLAFGKLNTSEIKLQLILNEEYEHELRPLVPEDRLRVWTCDGGVNGQDVRQGLRDIGFIENIHDVSHGDKLDHRRLAEADAERSPIEGYANWFANGHRELICKCGNGTVSKRPFLDNDGVAQVRSEGRCTWGCGSITITAGQWRRTQNPTSYVKCQPGEPSNDVQFGNPLTFHDAAAAIYGKRRWVAEGFNSHLEEPYEIIKYKSRWRQQIQVETFTHAVCSVIVALAIDGMRWERKELPQARSRRNRANRLAIRLHRSRAGKP